MVIIKKKSRSDAEALEQILTQCSLPSSRMHSTVSVPAPSAENENAVTLVQHEEKESGGKNHQLREEGMNQEEESGGRMRRKNQEEESLQPEPDTHHPLLWWPSKTPAA